MKITLHATQSELYRSIGITGWKSAGQDFSTFLQEKLRQTSDSSPLLAPDETRPIEGKTETTSIVESRPNDKDYALLGIVDQQCPTISHLLMRSGYGEDCWKIIHSSVNENKPYTQIAPGTPVYLSRANNELVWGDMRSKITVGDSPSPLDSTPPGFTDSGSVTIADAKENIGADLLRSVRACIGKAYNSLDCYELVVEGLKKMGYRYSGGGGLQEHLIQMAQAAGLTDNAFLSGEGLISAVGKNIYSAKIAHPSANSAGQIQELKDQLYPLLTSGNILSFSTPTHGHTGIVSQKDGNWTYINSGLLDHPVEGPLSVKKGVGEEDLTSEIRNWLRLASRRHEPLQITAGSLDADRLASYAIESS